MRTALILGLAGLALPPMGLAAQEKKPAGDPKEIVARLLKDLKDPGDVQRRVQAAMGLADFGPLAEPAVPDLVAALGSTDEDLRLNAAIALGKVGKAAVPALRKLLDSSDKDARFYAIWALGWVGPDARECTPALIAAMADKDPAIRRKAAYALGRIAADPPKTIAVLLAAFKDDNEDVRQAAGDAVAKFGTDAVPGLLKALADPDRKVRVQAAHAVAEMGSDAKDTAPRLRELLLAKGPVDDGAVNSYAQALAKVGKAGVPALVDGLKDDRPAVRGAATQGLAQVGAEAVPALVDALGDKNVEVRRLAAQVLAPMRVGDKMVVTALAYAIKNDADEHVKQQCVMALQYLGAAGKLAAPALQQALVDPDPNLRQQAFYALQNMGENPRDGLLKALAHKDDRIRIHTAALMLQVQVEPNRAAEVLVGALKHKDDELRLTAVRALAQAHREVDKVLPLLTEGLKSKAPQARRQALQGLALLGPQAEPAISAVLDLLTDSDQQVRQDAVMTLQNVPGKAETVLPALKKLLKEDKVETRRVVVQVLWRYGDPAMPLLMEALKDGDASVRQQAVYSLQNLPGDLGPHAEALVALAKDKDLSFRSNVIYLLARAGEKGAVQLGELLRDPDESVRFQASQAMRNMGKHSGKVLAALAEATHDKNPNVRQNAIYALAQAGGEGAQALTKTYEESKEPQLRVQILQAMVFTEARPNALPLVKKALKDPDREVRRTAIQLLPNFGQTQEAFDVLAEAMKDKDLDIRVAATYALQAFSPKALPLLEEGLKSAKESALRQALLQVIVNGNHRAKGAIGPLTDCLKDTQPQVRWMAAQALGNLGADARDAVPMLKDLLNDPNPTVRQIVQAALSRIEPPKQ
jgi:HEAT repeat protein